jgi:hypothetical protein
MRIKRLNDAERRLWVLNDEGLYRWWQQSRIGMRRFLRENRNELDTCINRELNKEPAR